jgi:hypothetical protein
MSRCTQIHKLDIPIVVIRIKLKTLEPFNHLLQPYASFAIIALRSPFSPGAAP